jgi:hypothetical protein
MKDGKIGFRSVGITIALAIAGIAIGLSDFIIHKVSAMNFLTETRQIQPLTGMTGSTDLVSNTMGFTGVIVCIIFVAIAMYSIRSMA